MTQRGHHHHHHNGAQGDHDAAADDGTRERANALTGKHHNHDHDHGHDHGGGGPWDGLRHLLAPHSHDAADYVDRAMIGSGEAIGALQVSTLVPALPAGVQLIE